MRSQFAFTLIEALVALTIVMIISAFTFPGLQTLLQRNQDEILRNDLLTLFESARMHADLRHQTLALCKSNDQQTCSGSWSDGQLLFVDTTEDGIIHNKEQILESHSNKSYSGSLHARFYPYYRDYIQIHDSLADASDNGTLWYCRPGAKNPAWAIVINRFSKAHILMPNKNGEIKDSHDIKLIC